MFTSNGCEFNMLCWNIIVPNLEYFIHCGMPICEVSVSSKSDVRGRDSFEMPTNNSMKKYDDSPRRNSFFG